jgi:dolichol-phosphate mannosyltransferase
VDTCCKYSRTSRSGLQRCASIDPCNACIVALNLAVDVIVCDGGSTDGSNDAALLSRHGVRTLLNKTGPGKLSAQLRVLFAYAVEQGYAGMVMIDGNGKDGVEAIPQFLDALSAGVAW